MWLAFGANVFSLCRRGVRIHSRRNVRHHPDLFPLGPWRLVQLLLEPRNLRGCGRSIFFAAAGLGSVLDMKRSSSTSSRVCSTGAGRFNAVIGLQPQMSAPLVMFRPVKIGGKKSRRSLSGMHHEHRVDNRRSRSRYSPRAAYTGTPGSAVRSPPHHIGDRLLHKGPEFSRRGFGKQGRVLAGERMRNQVAAHNHKLCPARLRVDGAQTRLKQRISGCPRRARGRFAAVL